MGEEVVQCGDEPLPCTMGALGLYFYYPFHHSLALLYRSGSKSGGALLAWPKNASTPQIASFFAKICSSVGLHTANFSINFYSLSLPSVFGPTIMKCEGTVEGIGGTVVRNKPPLSGSGRTGTASCSWLQVRLRSRCRGNSNATTSTMSLMSLVLRLTR